MTKDDEDPRPQHKISGLIQSKLTSAFFAPIHGFGSGSTTSPYFFPTSHIGTKASRTEERDISGAAKGVLNLNLHTGRRSNLNRPPPTLKSSQSSRSSAMLAQVAVETKAVLPNVLKFTPNALPRGELYDPDNLFRLARHCCPKLPSTKIRVVNSDSIDAALSMSSRTAATATTPMSKPVLILNMANAYHAGGGWEYGALAQEEAMCYRSSLPFTLKTRFYPIPEAGAIYSPTVVVIRENMAQGHDLLDFSQPEDLPVVSCVSVAAIRGPDIVCDTAGRERYRYKQDREMMKEKMRVVLRIAAVRKHRTLVLGALGCGAFGNPREEVVQCWKEIFEEIEFGGGWWDTVVFAVMEPGEQKDGNGNFGVFYRGLDGLRA